MKNPHAQALGRLGGLARAKALTGEQRKASAQLARDAKRKLAEIRKQLEGWVTVVEHHTEDRYAIRDKGITLLHRRVGR